MAFCPGHITGFFIAREHDDPLMTGSMGAGMCISLGATSEVTVEEGDGIVVLIDGVEGGEVSRRAVEDLLEGRKLKVTVDTKLDLPPSQGFAMSAAGALSACFALAHLLDIPFQRCFEAAHRAEVAAGTGLGDVAALHRGGITLRRKEGLPPYGKVDRIPGSTSLVLCVLGDPLETATVLADEDVRKKLDLVGRRCMRSLEKRITLSNLFRASREFANETGLMGAEVRAALAALKSTGPASMTMLGNSIFCSGELGEQERILSAYGRTFRAEIDYDGPRVLDHS